MDSIVNAALVGSARAAVDDALPAATPEGRLIGALGGESAEQRLLLAAGVRAIYHLAGYTPERLETQLEPAPAETKMVCSPSAADLIHQFMTDRANDLLEEALERMDDAELILPPGMLPLALEGATVARRPLVAQVVGERGAWLSGFNSAWAWVRDAQVHRLDELPADAETIWQEGTPGDRLQILRRWRVTDPAKARDEVTAIWRQEKADFRVELTEALAVNLSADDEPLLETALDDRSVNVRAGAQRLLARIPGSGYSLRAVTRADALLSMGKKKLATTLPDKHAKSWERDGILAKTRQGMGERSWWLMQVIAVTPPAHWVERFGMPPADLIAAATDEHSMELLEGWSRATVLYAAEDWASALIEAWSKRLSKRNTGAVSPMEMCGLLLPVLSLTTLETIALDKLRQSDPRGGINWPLIARALPRPWSVSFARAWLAGMRTFAGEQLATLKGYVPDWWECSGDHPMMLPLECLDEALAPWETHIGKNKQWQAINWRDEHESFLKTLRLRQRIRDEIPGG